MNSLVTSRKNPCPSYKEYKMLPLERSKDAYSIKKRPPKAPKLSAQDPLIPYRILKLDGAIATICASMSTKLSSGELIVRDVNVSSLGSKGVRLGDIISFRTSDIIFEKPTITHRAHQQHQHPEQLVAPDEK